MEEITIPVKSYKDTEVTESLPDVIILHDNHVECKRSTTQIETEDGLPQPPKKYLGHTAALKKHIIGISAAWSDAHQKYQLNFIPDTEATCSPLFDTMKEANAVKNKILEWLLK